MSQIYKTKKKVNDGANVDVLSDDELSCLRTKADEGTLTAEERELYARHLKAMEKLIPKRSMSGKSKVDVLGLRVAKALITVALVMLALPFIISAIQLLM
jgi:hypothetical protein